MIILLIAGQIALLFQPVTKIHCQFTAQFTGHYDIHKMMYLGKINKSEYPECSSIKNILTKPNEDKERR